ncbi:MAG: hypothetical protein KBC95_00220 [Candidatus Peribacteraceae bacterium]|nr:hypothetical protein [Candidatus Peribacteraceae bacterium]
MPGDGATAGQPAATGASSIVIPPEVQAQFGDVLALIAASESMNAEERQYWVNILPVMTPEQVQNLRDILQNEKNQLAAIDQKYTQDVDKIGQQQQIQQTDDERRRRAAERQAAEQNDKTTQNQAEQDLLNQINQIG